MLRDFWDWLKWRIVIFRIQCRIFKGIGVTAYTWNWDSEPLTEEDAREFTEELLSWLDEQVLRAPTPLGLDTSIIQIAIGNKRKPWVMYTETLDKWGYRRRGKAAISQWLLDNFPGQKSGNFYVSARVISMGRLLLGQGGPEVYQRA